MFVSLCCSCDQMSLIEVSYYASNQYPILSSLTLSGVLYDILINGEWPCIILDTKCVKNAQKWPK